MEIKAYIGKMKAIIIESDHLILKKIILHVLIAFYKIANKLELKVFSFVIHHVYYLCKMQCRSHLDHWVYFLKLSNSWKTVFPRHFIIFRMYRFSSGKIALNFFNSISKVGWVFEIISRVKNIWPGLNVIKIKKQYFLIFVTNFVTLHFLHDYGDLTGCKK